MAFLDRLRAYLERCAQAADGLPYLTIDLAAHRRHLLAELDRLEASGVDSASDRTLWISHGSRFLPAFAHHIAQYIIDELSAEMNTREMGQLIDAAISHQLGSDLYVGGRLARDRLIEREALLFERHWPKGRRFDAWIFLPRYAFELRLVRRSGDRVEISPLGAMLLELPGIEAVSWLIKVEVAQSTGPKDNMRLSQALAQELLSVPERHHWLHEPEDRLEWRFSHETLRRLEALELVRVDPLNDVPEYDWGYTVLPSARPLLQEIAERRPTPLAVLADALLRDEAASLIQRVRPELTTALHEGAAQATALQARMVAHELRNALVPSQLALAGLFESLKEESESMARYRRRIETGIMRSLSFVEEMLRTANLGATPIEPFEVVEAVREALAALAGLLNGSVRFIAPDDAIEITGPRARFILALVNLLRNAAQSLSGSTGIVQVSIDAGAPSEECVLYVDDNGPGVPEEHRRAIFQSGVTLRSGGSGQGLALVRQVIENEMSGTVACETSPLGGARFSVSIPRKRAVAS